MMEKKLNFCLNIIEYVSYSPLNMSVIWVMVLSGEKFDHIISLCVCVCLTKGPMPIWHGRTLSTKSSVSRSKLEMPISLYTAPYLISPLPPSHHLAHV